MRTTSMVWVEWPTLLLIVACYFCWAIGTTFLSGLWLPAGIVVTTLSMAFYSSLQHEVIHGHPFAQKWANEMLVFPALVLFIPYQRFRDTHLAHHRDSLLTDPYDDPESNYFDPEVWAKLPAAFRLILRFNNTMAGRLLVGPVLSQIDFMRSDWLEIRNGNRFVLAGWLWHFLALLPVLIWMFYLGTMPVWALLLSAYMALSILKIRTFLEHQANEHASHRTVVIEDRGPMALMFLNNNLHIVHHMHPKAPWYILPDLYFSNRERYLKRNGGYCYRSYAEVFARYFFKAKDPVPHPIWRRR